ncbi:hypothetical protein BJF85_06110 [Saccharomonospora sp. CUA-673]|nr:hypothetical protein BJF85_06110 [Saccharomonospora sp. CUA-673]
MSNYRVDEGKLSTIVRDLRAGSSSLDEVAEKLPEAVNAGFSSDVANAALARVGQIALALAQQGQTIAANVDTAEGMYQAAEDEHRNEVETTDPDVETTDQHEKRKRAEAPPKLEEAPPDPEEHKNRPQPQTETAPAPTPPPSPTP